MTNSSPYVPEGRLDAGVAVKRPSLCYETGEPIKVGDQVDFGLDPRQIGIDPVEGPWVGTVASVNIAAGTVLVDTFCNSREPYPPAELTLLGRWPEGKPRYSVPTAVGSSKWYVCDDMLGGSVAECPTQAEAEAKRDQLNVAHQGEEKR